ncbi:peptidase M50 [Mycobacterium vicinigordonae]|uniref:Peptidase M50 n=1 Tax=Mycobacterium vicinigordonae TaxID=1719132 RepID=A0A7D6DYT6_9MYCO|nr:peptidase M50 [Mycobacterium vicinigordonae]QLL08067.1 peptidase M50 [Mycobacterium vicinigordonae]
MPSKRVKANHQPPVAAVLLFDDARVPRALAALPVHRNLTADLDPLLRDFRRLVVVGSDADLAMVLTRLLRTDRLDMEVAYAPRRRTCATRAYRLPAGRRAARRALRGSASRVPLIRDETATVLVGRTRWLPVEGATAIRGEAVVDDTVLFDGDAAELWVEPTLAVPGLRAALADQGWWRRWVGGRAAQLGTTGAVVQRDGVTAPRAVRRSTFYRNVEGWLLVR